MRTDQARRRRGFTLVETVVTVGIVATLAAVVYPSVVKQFDSADPTRAAEDLNAIRTGIETFGVNVRPNQPGDIEDLANPIVPGSGTELTARGAQYTVTDSLNWIGPYLGLAVATTAGEGDVVITTGFSATITNRLLAFDAAPANGGDTTLTIADAEFLAVRVVGLSAAAFNAINTLIDGTSEITVAQRRHGGRFRCPGEAAPGNVGGAADTACTRGAFFLASPFR